MVDINELLEKIKKLGKPKPKKEKPKEHNEYIVNISESETSENEVEEKLEKIEKIEKIKRYLESSGTELESNNKTINKEKINEIKEPVVKHEEKDIKKLNYNKPAQLNEENAINKNVKEEIEKQQENQTQEVEENKLVNEEVEKERFVNTPEEEYNENKLEDMIEEPKMEKLDEDFEELDKSKKSSGYKASFNIPYLDEHQEIIISKPSLLDIDPSKHVKQEIERIKEHVKSSAVVDKNKLFRELLELTKKYMEEQDLRKKQQIKSEISEIRATLESLKTKKKTIDPADVLYNIQKEELDKLINQLREELKIALDMLYSQVTQAKNISGNEEQLLNEIRIQFNDDIESLKKQWDQILNLSMDFIINLHKNEINEVRGMSEKNIPFDLTSYQDIFNTLKKEGHKKIDELINKCFPTEGIKAEVKKISHPTNQKAESLAYKHNEEKVVEEPEENLKESIEKHTLSAEEIIKKIKDTPEVQILHLLSKKDRTSFLRYIRGEISKEEALKRGMRIMAKELGMLDGDIDKYFS